MLSIEITKLYEYFLSCVVHPPCLVVPMSALVVQYGLDAIDPGLPLVQRRQVETIKDDMFE